MLNRTEKRLLDSLEPYAEKNGIEIVTIEIIGSKKNPTVRVYIDVEETASATKTASESCAQNDGRDEDTVEGVTNDNATIAPKTSISFDELAASQSWISGVLDDIDPFAGSYTLEVSSPGIDRPLRTPEHFNRFAGDEATVKLKGRINNKSTIRGEIVSANATDVVLRVDGEDINVPFSEMKRANLKGKVEFR